MGETLWKIAGRTIDLSQHALIMGVLNVTPDSFSDGGEFFAAEKAIEQGVTHGRRGRAKSSTWAANRPAPARQPVSAEEELARVLPVIEKLRGAIRGASFPSTPRKAAVARGALEAGASIINDVTRRPRRSRK